MAKSNFSDINVKAAVITGGIVGFLCWLLVILFGVSGYGMVGHFGGYGMIGYGSYSNYGYMMGNTPHNVIFGYMMNGAFYPYNSTGYYPTVDVFHSYSLYSIIIDMALGALVGFVIAVIYNWTLRLK